MRWGKIRKDKVLTCLEKLCHEINLDDILKGFNGFDATYIGTVVGISRSNASKELNDIFNEDLIIKVSGKPVYYFSKKRIMEITQNYHINIMGAPTSLKSLCSDMMDKCVEEREDPFENLIGNNESLKIPINQAKAAILYPPKGLNTILIGATGVGKSTFAETMYKYALNLNIIGKKANFITFNCAEYADNPNLLLSQLFGYVKGAFTGAEKDKDGLIAKADGGIMLLDEVHRLPPEGQEMLFVVMDKGIYRRLGETENNRKASILFICATTEDTNSYLLKTFLRRVPMVIKIPELAERSDEERLELIKAFFNNEAKIVGMPINVSKDVIGALIMYKCKSNIGQLKADIQLICAKGYLEYKTQHKESIQVGISSLPEHVYYEVVNMQQRISKKMNIIDEMFNVVSSYVEFTGNYNKNLETKDEYSLNINLYEEINYKYNTCVNLGYEDNVIKDEITEYVSRYLNRLISKIKINNTVEHKKELFKIINPGIYDAVELALSESIKDKIYDSKTITALAMHVNSVVESLDKKVYKPTKDIHKFFDEKSTIYKSAKCVYDVLTRELNKDIPREEIDIIAMFLDTLNERRRSEKSIIPVIVICHGESSATSMVKVAEELLQVNHCYAINMLLTEDVKNVLNKTEEMVKNIDQGKGVLILVDMGSLVAFSDIITKDTKIKTRSVDMVSTAVVLEAARKSMFQEYTLNDLADELQLITPYMGRNAMKELKSEALDTSDKLIITTCITGDGVAKKIAGYLKENYPIIREYSINITPMNKSKYLKLKDMIKIENVLAVIGTMDIGVQGVPFISISDFIIGDGNKIIRDLIVGNYSLSSVDVEANIGLMVNTLGSQLTFLDSTKAYCVLEKSFSKIKHYIRKEHYVSSKVRFIIHGAFMIERCFRNEAFKYKGCNEKIKMDKIIFDELNDAMNIVRRSFGVNIPDDEICYLIDFIYEAQNCDTV